MKYAKMPTIVVWILSIMAALLRVLAIIIPMLVGMMDLVLVVFQDIHVSISRFQEEKLCFRLMVFGN